MGNLPKKPRSNNNSNLFPNLSQPKILARFIFLLLILAAIPFTVRLFSREVPIIQKAAPQEYEVKIISPEKGEKVSGTLAVEASVIKEGVISLAAAGSKKPICRIEAYPTSGPAPLTVRFDGAGSYDPDGRVARYAWSFSDGYTTTEYVFNRTFNDPGEYTASLVVEDNSRTPSDLCQVRITVTSPQGNRKPICRISANPRSGTAPLSVNFDGSGSYDPDGRVVRYAWSLSTGYTTEAVSFSYAFSNPGDYVASLVVADDKNAPSDLCQVTITVTARGGNQSPICRISAEPRSGTAPLSVNFDASSSYDPDGRVVRYAWSISDGFTSDRQSFSHTFSNPGDYRASLVVEDDKGAPSNLCQVTITVAESGRNQKPVCRLEANPTSGRAPLAVQFDGSRSYDPDGRIVRYAWSISDGFTSDKQNFSHTFANPGNYQVSLVVEDDKGTPSDLCQATITVTGAVRGQRPLCQIGAFPTSGAAPLTVDFDSSRSSDPDGRVVRYAWAISDGFTSASSRFSHTFSRAGNYTASLVVEDNDRNSSNLCQVTISVFASGENRKPLCRIYATPTSGASPLTVYFDGSGSYDPDGSIARYAWSITDGYTTTERSFSHTFSNPGSYLASLVVADDKKAPSDLCQVTITVQPPKGNKKPICRINASSTSGKAPLRVRFDAFSSYDPDGRIAGYAWSMSNGYTTERTNFSYTFREAGEYVVALVVVDNKKAPSDLCQVTIKVTGTQDNQKPVCQINASPTSGIAPLGVRFYGLRSYDPDGRVVRYAWAISDGYTTQASDFNYTFRNAGRYIVSLVVEDDKKAPSDLCQATIVVGSSAKTLASLAKVQFWLDNEKLGDPVEELREGQYLLSLDSTTLKDGEHKLAASVEVAGETKVSSEAVTILVSNASVGEPMILTLKPESDKVGWVSSADASGNHFGDDDMFTGYFGSDNYHGAFQVSLSEIPPEAKIKEAKITLTGQTRAYMFAEGGEYRLQLLKPEIDENWASWDYKKISEAEVLVTLEPVLNNKDLGRAKENVFSLGAEALSKLQERVKFDGTFKVSFRLDGPKTGQTQPVAGFDIQSNLFSWDSGYGSGGLQKPPILEITYFEEVPKKPQ